MFWTVLIGIGLPVTLFLVGALYKIRSDDLQWIEDHFDRLEAKLDAHLQYHLSADPLHRGVVDLRPSEVLPTRNRYPDVGSVDA